MRGCVVEVCGARHAVHGTSLGKANALRSGDPSGDPEVLLRVEQDIREHFHDAPWFDFHAHRAVVNIYRAAITVRNRLEQDLRCRAGSCRGAGSRAYGCCGFPQWGEMESRRLAHESGVSKGTLTGLVITLEKRGLVTRRRLHRGTGGGWRCRSHRRGWPWLRSSTRTSMRASAPLTAGLGTDERVHLARLLRSIMKSATAPGLLDA